MSGTYRDVDGSPDPDEAADWLDRVNAWPAIQACKQWTLAQLRGLEPVLDVGCGTGGDLASLRTIGVDPSQTMVQRARARGGLVVRGRVERLPFADRAFGGTRADRVLQHLDDPLAALREMIRVTRPGGIVVAGDPDQGSLVIEVPWVRRALVEEVRRYRRDVLYRHGTLARKFAGIFASLGLSQIEVHAEVLVLTDPDLAFGLPTWVRHRHETAGDISTGVVEEWDAGMTRARAEPGFVYAVTYLVTSGRRTA